MSTIWARLVSASAMALMVVSTVAGPDYGKVELLRDQWGIPHVFSDTDGGAMYGLGYATAQERGFQMTYGLRVMQGRLAEILGERPRGGRKETALDNDRRMRTFGWTRAASRIAAKLDPGTRGLLEAYCDGVNATFAAQQKADTLHPLFKQLDVVAEKWTPADCLLSWWHVAQYFAGDGTRDLVVWRNRTQPPPGAPAMPLPSASWVDDTHQDPKATFEADECRFIDRVISEAWNVGGSTGRNGVRPAAMRAGAQKPSLGWFDSLDGFGSLDPAQDVSTPGITCLDGQTIHCQSAQSYTQWVPLHDVDSAKTVCPIGHSDRPDSRYRTSTMELWATAKLHPAPLSRQAVERITAERAILLP